MFAKSIGAAVLDSASATLLSECIVYLVHVCLIADLFVYLSTGLLMCVCSTTLFYWLLFVFVATLVSLDLWVHWSICCVVVNHAFRWSFFPVCVSYFVSFCFCVFFFSSAVCLLTVHCSCVSIGLFVALLLVFHDVAVAVAVAPSIL